MFFEVYDTDSFEVYDYDIMNALLGMVYLGLGKSQRYTVKRFNSHVFR